MMMMVVVVAVVVPSILPFLVLWLTGGRTLVKAASVEMEE